MENSKMEMLVVRINYRVGILGFLAGSTVTDDRSEPRAVANNGLGDSRCSFSFCQD